MISVEEALATICAHSEMLDVETVSLEKLNKRVSAETVRAKTTVPPNAMSAMDGYGVRFDSAKKIGDRLQVIGEVPAGEEFSGMVGAGEAVRIFTGGKVPKGADHIVIQEDVSREGDWIALTCDQKKPSHIRQAGIDFRAGDEIIGMGEEINAYKIAVLASADHGAIKTIRRPKVAIIANGNELIEPGQGGKGILSSTPYGLLALLEEWGCEGEYLGIAGDSPEAIKEKIDAAKEFDLIIPLGGASVGDYDYMKPSFADAGFEFLFQKIKIKPGKPTWFARRSSPTIQYVLGLPGNPASAMVCAHLFVKPLTDNLRGMPVSGHEIQMAVLGTELPKQGGRDEYLRGVLEIANDGCQIAKPLSRQDSSLLTPFLQANCFIVRRAGARAASSGDIVEVIRL